MKGVAGVAAVDVDAAPNVNGEAGPLVPVVAPNFVAEAPNVVLGALTFGLKENTPAVVGAVELIFVF